MRERETKLGWCPVCDGQGEHFSFDGEFMGRCENCNGTAVVSYIPFTAKQQAEQREREHLQRQLAEAKRQGEVTS